MHDSFPLQLSLSDFNNSYASAEVSVLSVMFIIFILTICLGCVLQMFLCSPPLLFNTEQSTTSFNTVNFLCCTNTSISTAWLRLQDIYIPFSIFQTNVIIPICKFMFIKHPDIQTSRQSINSMQIHSFTHDLPNLSVLVCPSFPMQTLWVSAWSWQSFWLDIVAFNNLSTVSHC